MSAWPAVPMSPPQPTKRSATGRSRSAAAPLAALEPAALAAGLIVLFVAGYFGIGATRDPLAVHELGTSLDARIPFVAASVWTYLWVFPAACLPLCVVRCRRLLRRTALAYALAMAGCFACFAVWPVGAEHLRSAALDPSSLSGWTVVQLYRLDPPVNLFPSLHLAIAALAAYATWRVAPRLGGLAFCGTALIAVSVCTVKQHFLADAAAGLLLAAGLATIVLRPWRAPADQLPNHGSAGLAAFALLQAGFYGAIGTAYLLRG